MRRCSRSSIIGIGGGGQLGPYTFISAYIVAEKKYGYAPFPVFMLARDGKIIADDPQQGHL